MLSPSEATTSAKPLGEASARKKVLLVALGGATLVAALQASQINLEMLHHGHDWWRIFAWQWGVWAFWALVAPWILAAGGQLLRKGTRPRGWPLRELGKALALTALHLPLSAALYWVLQPYEPIANYSFGVALEKALHAWLLIDPLIYGLGLVAGSGFRAARQARLAELRHANLEKELARAQLEALRLQIQPHFLFNTLHSIGSLVRREKNDQALEMLLGLSGLLRATLEGGAEPEVSLAQEVHLTRLYAELQQTRFGDRLEVRFKVEEAALERPVPVLLLQPLVENALRHGFGQRPGPGVVEVQGALSNGDLRLAVTDDGAGLPPGFSLERDAGVGLANLRARLALYRSGQDGHGGQGRLELRQRSRGGTVAEVVLPQAGTEATANQP